MGQIIQSKVLGGFRDFLPDMMIKRKGMMKILEGAFESFGFVPIDTPVLEYTEILLGKGGGETDKQIYRFEDNGGRDVAMRFDLTVPFARFVAGHLGDLQLPFKRYHIDKVWRAEKAQKGRYREFVQCDFDIVGVDSAAADFEILFMMYSCFKALGIERFKINISNRGIFNALLGKLGIQENLIEVLRTIDKLGKIGPDKVKELLAAIASPEHIEAILDFIQPEADSKDTLKKIIAAVGDDENVQRLASVMSFIEEAGISGHFYIDTSITRGLDYYTGLVFETFLSDLPQIGSVCSGGRYNNLTSVYTKQQVPGVGASVGLDRLYAALEELGFFKETKTTAKLMVVCMDESFSGHYQSMAAKFRAAGIPTEVYPAKKKLMKQLIFAEKKGIKAAVIIGEDEKEKNVMNIKDLTARENFDGLGFDEGLTKVKEIIES